jgi:hypothetical protein
LERQSGGRKVAIVQSEDTEMEEVEEEETEAEYPYCEEMIREKEAELTQQIHTDNENNVQISNQMPIHDPNYIQLILDSNPNTSFEERKKQFIRLLAYSIIKMLNKHNERFESDVSVKKEDVIWCTNRFGESIFSYLKSLLDDAPTTRDLILSSTIKV